MRLGKRYGEERRAAACPRALLLGACSSKSIDSMRTHGLALRPVPEQRQTTPLPRHAHIRGPQYDAAQRGAPSGARIRRGTNSRPAADMGWRRP
jgi:hypothetical protein